MKQITAVIQPIRLGPVREGLTKAGITGMTVTDVRGFGSQGGSIDTYRGVEYRVDYVPKLQLDIVLTDDLLESVVNAIIEGAQTGKLGDGKIWVRDIESVVRVRTGERDVAALT